jgi:hypothetical protein
MTTAKNKVRTEKTKAIDKPAEVTILALSTEIVDRGKIEDAK